MILQESCLSLSCFLKDKFIINNQSAKSLFWFQAKKVIFRLFPEPQFLNGCWFLWEGPRFHIPMKHKSACC